MQKKIESHFQKLVVDNQHGFVKGRSTLTNLSILISNAFESFKDKDQIDCIYTDFRKAFDIVNINVLINKLYKYKFPIDIILWIESYLSNRSARIKLNNTFSDWFWIKSGVPQVYQLGPILFLVFINDLIDNLEFLTALLFADDLKLLYRISSVSDCIKLKNDLNKIVNWCAINLMQLNIEKCCVISFSRKKDPILFDYYINNIKLQRVEIVKDLGIWLDSKLKFKEHLNKVTLKANRRWYNIVRNTKDFKNPNTFKILYTSLVRSVMSYGSVIWKPLTKNSMQRLEKIQHKALRKIAFLDGNAMDRFSHNYTFIANKFLIPSISSFFDYCDLLFLYKISTNSLCKSIRDIYITFEDVDYSLRFKKPFKEKFSSSKFMHQDPYIRIPYIYNKCSEKYKAMLHFDILYDNMKIYLKNKIFCYC